MPRNPRLDTPGSWHHVMNRGIARRSVFEGSADIRVFLACLARECRRGAIELHAYSILTTHFHLLIRSPRGELSLAMQRAQNRYVRYFNRSRRRDGPLFRGRFRSKPIDSLEYRKCVPVYIDANPVEAGIVRRSQDYPFGSRCRYEEAVGPPWLKRAWVESAIQSAARRGAVPPSYEMVFFLDLQREPFELVERRLMSLSSGAPTIDANQKQTAQNPRFVKSVYAHYGVEAPAGKKRGDGMKQRGGEMKKEMKKKVGAVKDAVRKVKDGVDKR